MLSPQSLKERLLWQLVLASLVLIGIFSATLYSFIKNSIYEDTQQQLIKQAIYIKQHFNNKNIDSLYFQNSLGISVKIVHPKDIHNLTFKKIKKGKKSYLILYYPYQFQEQNFLQIKKDITSLDKLLHKILKIILVANIISFVFIIIFALVISHLVTRYIQNLTKKLANMNEHSLRPLKVKTLPVEFQPLGHSINMLLNRIKTFVKYQKELFIGIAHELKTPLAVMKLKNEVTLLKKRTPEEYIKTLKLNIETINEMNKMIEQILKIGRQEGDQFEPPIEMDLIEYLKKKAQNYNLLATHEGKSLELDLKPKYYKAFIQPTLLDHILQNFIQNAIKFTPKGGKIILKSEPKSGGIKIEVIDEGPGIDEGIDYFAPFKRKGKQSGAGLGLFLAKSAADAMGANIELKRRKDRPGTIASLFIPSHLACPI